LNTGTPQTNVLETWYSKRVEDSRTGQKMFHVTVSLMFSTLSCSYLLDSFYMNLTKPVLESSTYLMFGFCGTFCPFFLILTRPELMTPG
jgi:hypothetical protein